MLSSFQASFRRSVPSLSSSIRARQSALKPLVASLSQRSFASAGSRAVASTASPSAENSNQKLQSVLNDLNAQTSKAASAVSQTSETASSEQPLQARGLLNRLRGIKEKGLVFEFSMLWVITAYREIAIGIIRNSFYTFRPVIMFFAMGYVVKFAFFLMGAPMLVSFYSVWLFEVGYGLAQCVLSVIFLTQLAYADLSFRGRLRPLVQLGRKRVVDVLKSFKGKMLG